LAHSGLTLLTDLPNRPGHALSSAT